MCVCVCGNAGACVCVQMQVHVCVCACGGQQTNWVVPSQVLSTFSVYACDVCDVCAYYYGSKHMCLWVCVHVYMLGTGSLSTFACESFNPKIITSTKLPSQWTSEFCLSPPPHYPSAESQEATLAPAPYVGSRDLDLVIMFARQTLNNWATSSAPPCFDTVWPESFRGPPTSSSPAQVLQSYIPSLPYFMWVLGIGQVSSCSLPGLY